MVLNEYFLNENNFLQALFVVSSIAYEVNQKGLNSILLYYIICYISFEYEITMCFTTFSIKLKKLCIYVLGV